LVGYTKSKEEADARGWGRRVKVLENAGLYTDPGAGEVSWIEHLRVADLSVGTYSIPAGGIDGQAPHTEDEIYVVTQGSATLVTDDGDAPVGAGSVVYVPANESHRFVDVGEDFAVLVLFAPAEYTRQGG
jgi:mannose-6-phosphate isomerase-like protein (cupin superfamily)